MSSKWVEVELDADRLAEQIGHNWSIEDILKLVQKINEHKADWGLISLLKPWVDAEHRRATREELEDKAQREGKCQSAGGIMVHVNPHRGCVIR